MMDGKEEAVEEKLEEGNIEGKRSSQPHMHDCYWAGPHHSGFAGR